MSSWAGFSDEELRRLQQKEEHNDAAVRASLGRGRRSAPTNRSRQQLQRERALQVATKQNDGSGSLLSPEQQLKPPPPPLQPSPNTTASSKVSEPRNKGPNPSEPETVKHESEPQPEDPPVMIKELDKVEVELREKTRLQQLQWEQRMMEEKNKKRKALLAKTIAEKSKQTQAEAVKLKKIQKELQALDDSVSNDIAILRTLIEHASLEYSVAWKRLEKAEAEYVAAKLDLHKKTEVKEQLTEHLSTIIQQNELRKARKLEELMLQLELNAEEVAAPESHSHTTPQDGGKEKEMEKEEGDDLSQPTAVSRPTEESDEKTQTESTDIIKDSVTIVPNASQDQMKELLKTTAESTS
ncbi:RAB6-interacting golgin [Hoplias malabaricus]|uniref:RAB6-interacting golgin n=1 Tax=Hoplias malabaricus TaxID=27720 RepID=UPI003461DFDB